MSTDQRNKLKRKSLAKKADERAVFAKYAEMLVKCRKARSGGINTKNIVNTIIT